MGEKNDQINEYLRDSGRFADFFNVNLFGGEKVIKPEELTAGDTTTIHVKSAVHGKKAKKSRETSGDIVKLWHVPRDYGTHGEKGILLSILCLETQNHVHYAMPIRGLCYEADRYEEQYKDIAGEHRREKDLTADEYVSGFSREDKIYPVISFVLYMGSSPWDGPKNLYSMISFKSFKSKVRLLLKKYAHDYKLNLLDINSVAGTEEYRSELREVFGILCRQNDKQKMKSYIDENDRLKTISREGAGVIESYAGISNLKWNEEEETMDMCKAMRDWSEEEQEKGREAGLAEGREVGRAEGASRESENIVRAMLRNKQTPEFISEVTEKPLEYVYHLQTMMVREESSYSAPEEK